MEITKIGLATMKDGAVLLVRKRNSRFYILPGGKPEANERDDEALRREVMEELGCYIVPNTIEWLGVFRDAAAGMPGVTVTVRLYRAELMGSPQPSSEIESLTWFTPDQSFADDLAPSLRNSILPYLFRENQFSCNTISSNFR